MRFYLPAPCLGQLSGPHMRGRPTRNLGPQESSTQSLESVEVKAARIFGAEEGASQKDGVWRPAMVSPKPLAKYLPAYRCEHEPYQRKITHKKLWDTGQKVLTGNPYSMVERTYETPSTTIHHEDWTFPLRSRTRRWFHLSHFY